MSGMGGEIPGPTPGERAAIDRLLAGSREVRVARFSMEIAAADCAGVFRNFATALGAAEAAIAAEEAKAVAGHPDLAEMNVALDAWYPGVEAS